VRSFFQPELKVQSGEKSYLLFFYLKKMSTTNRLSIASDPSHPDYAHARSEELELFYRLTLLAEAVLRLSSSKQQRKSDVERRQRDLDQLRERTFRDFGI
jgi:hypothetical protein